MPAGPARGDSGTCCRQGGPRGGGPPRPPGGAARGGAGARGPPPPANPIGSGADAAADPLLACILTGLGITSLSAAAPAVSPVGATLATIPLETCRHAAQAVLATTDPSEARAVARTALGLDSSQPAEIE